jgi:hypothetical protein
MFGRFVCRVFVVVFVDILLHMYVRYYFCYTLAVCMHAIVTSNHTLQIIARVQHYVQLLLQ